MNALLNPSHGLKAALLKGLRHPRRMRFEIVGRFLKYRRRVQETVFICLNHVHLRNERFIYKSSLVITAVSWYIFESLYHIHQLTHCSPFNPSLLTKEMIGKSLIRPSLTLFFFQSYFKFCLINEKNAQTSSLSLFLLSTLE